MAVPIFTDPERDAELLAQSRHDLELLSGPLRRRQTQVRHGWVRRTGESTEVPVAGRLAARSGKYGAPFRLHLLALWVCGATPSETMRRPADRGYEPHTTSLLQQENLGELLALAQEEPKRRHAVVRHAVGALTEPTSPLLTRKDDPDGLGWVLGLLDETGTGDPYRNAGQAAREGKEQEGQPRVEDQFFRVPPELFTNGWWATLPVPALHLLLWLWSHSGLNRPPATSRRGLDGVAPHDDTYASARHVLTRWGLAVETPKKYGRRKVYNLAADATAVQKWDAPQARPPSTRMSARAWDTWLADDPDRRMPQRTTAAAPEPAIDAE